MGAQVPEVTPIPYSHPSLVCISMAIPVVVLAITGDGIQFNVEPPIKIGTLKQHIFTTWVVPPECQQLLLGNQLLEPASDHVVDCPPDDSLVLTMLLSIEGQLASLKSESSWQTDKALRILGSFGSKFSRPVLDALQEHLNTCRRTEVAKTLRTMAELLQPGDEFAMTLANQYLHDTTSTGDMQAAAVTVLAKIMSEENTSAISLLSHCLTQSAVVRVAAVNALHVFAGNEQAVLAVRQHLDHPDFGSRYSAIQALQVLSEKGDEDVISDLCKCLIDKDPNVRFAADTALHHVTGHPHEEDTHHDLRGKWTRALRAC